MPSLKVLLTLAALACARSAGGVGAGRTLARKAARDEPNRMQQWLVPSPAMETLSHAVLFRPPGEGPFPLAVIAHATTQNVLRRAQMPQPEYRALAAWLVARGFAVLVPERPGHGATGGKYLEDQGGCDEADYRQLRPRHRECDRRGHGLYAQATLHQARTAWSMIGHSAGGWGALALASEDPKDVAAIIVFAAGRGGRANDFPNQDLRAAYADRGGKGIRQGRARAGDLAGRGQ